MQSVKLFYNIVQTGLLNYNKFVNFNKIILKIISISIYDWMTLKQYITIKGPFSGQDRIVMIIYCLVHQ